MNYVPIPVATAKRIAEEFRRDIVIINAWSHQHRLMHTVTYGVSPADKVSAACGGETCARVLGMDTNQSSFTEDFRREYNAARERAMFEAISRHLPELRQIASQIVHPKDNVFSRMVASFERAIASEPKPGGRS